MKILGIQKHHNSSACLFIDGELIYYNQEERLSRKKRDYGIPIECLYQIKDVCDTIDCVVITGYNYNGEENTSIFRLLQKMGFKVEKWFSFYKGHHLSHAARAFYSSRFDDALIIVSDGRGSEFTLNDGSSSYETTSAYVASYPNNLKLVYKRLYSDRVDLPKNILPSTFAGRDSEDKLTDVLDSIEIKNVHDIAHFYEYVTLHLGFDLEECGKTMGLQSYGDYNDNIPKLTFDHDVCRELFCVDRSRKINCEKYPVLKNHSSNEKNLIDFAFHTQKIFQEVALQRIERLLKMSGCKNLVLTGGTGLNVVANNYFRKKISSDVQIYIDPLCGDEGNCLGAAQLYFYDESQTKTKFVTDGLYLGPKPNYEFTLNGVDECFDSVSKKQIVELLHNKKIVSIFQGGSEAGPRALGNRSILFDPRVKDGKDIVNKVKKREWFRPFACTILLEHSRDWFDMHCLDESPHMMYALDALPGVKEKIPAVVHVDNTCRVQTLTKERNEHFYELIDEFHKMTGVPLLLNTSFNLAGDPLVETIDDALETLRKSELEYLYLPELNKLVYIKNENKQLT